VDSALEKVDDAQALGVVLEAALPGHEFVQDALPGVTERCVAEVVREERRLGKVLVEPQRPRDGARDLRASMVCVNRVR